MLLVDNEVLLLTVEEDDDDALPLMVTTLDLRLTMTMNSIPIPMDGRCGRWNEILHTVAQSDAIQRRSTVSVSRE